MQARSPEKGLFLDISFITEIKTNTLTFINSNVRLSWTGYLNNTIFNDKDGSFADFNNGNTAG
jgi:hypothetical protein